MGDTCDRFAKLLVDVEAIISAGGRRDDVLAGVCSLLAERVAVYDWVGFYIADEVRQELTLGPYAGRRTDHVRIPYGRGICGQVAQTRQGRLVEDVRREDNYLSCSPHVRSEAVVPIFRDGALVSELDIDSHTPASFGQDDLTFLTARAKLVADLL